MQKFFVAPSILSSDFAILAKECARMLDAGANWLHVDVMDGHFVPNLTLGAPIVKSLRKHTEGFLDCHLMVSEPEKWVKDFAAAGADMFTFHIEAATDAKQLIADIKEAGMKVGVAVKPKTPVEDILPFCGDIDMALVMTVEPGFGGQSFMGDMMSKVSTIRKLHPEIIIQVDGGLGLKTIDTAVEAGANSIVAGTAIFKAEDPKSVIDSFKATHQKYHH